MHQPNTTNQAIPLRLSEVPRYAIWPTDFFLSYFRSPVEAERKKRVDLLIKSLKGDFNSRFNLGREIFRFANNSAPEWERRAYYGLAKRLFYKVLRNPDLIPGRQPVKASTYMGTIAYIEGDEEAAVANWTFAAERDEAGAMYELGKLHKQRKERGEALHWIQLAAGLNHEKSIKLLQRMKSAPRPDYNLNPRAAELHIEEWMAHWGFHDAQATPVGPDGGFDVKSKRAAAQVKFRGQATPLEQINAFHGACNSRYEFEIFVSKSGYTKPAREAADEYGMALFTLEEDGTPIPINFNAKRIYRD